MSAYTVFCEAAVRAAGGGTAAFARLVDAAREVDRACGEDVLAALATVGMGQALLGLFRRLEPRMPLETLVVGVNGMSTARAVFASQDGPGDFGRTVIAVAVARGLLALDGSGGMVEVTSKGAVYADAFEAAAVARGLM